MNFAYGVIAAVGILVAITLGLIAVDPGYLPEPQVQETAMEELPPVSAIVSLPQGSGIPGCESTNECFIPYNIQVNAGGTVIWNNDDTLAHTVTSGTVLMGADGLFDSSILMEEDSFEFTFDNAGEYDYYCIVHPWMEGKITVI